MRFKADIFFFGIFFIAGIVLTMSFIKQVTSPMYKQGLRQSSEIMTRNVR